MHRSRILVLLLAPLCAAAAAAPAPPPADPPATQPARFDLVLDADPAPIVIAEAEHPGVRAAAKDLQRDVTKICGVTPNIVHAPADCGSRCIVIGSAGSPAGRTLLGSVGVAVDDLSGKWESYKWRVLNGAGGKEQVLAIAGSDVRGAIYGVYEFERLHMGVDPLWFWADHDPPMRAALSVDARAEFGPSNPPTWRYRGWTLNDHPQFMEWIESGLVHRTRYSRYMFSIHGEVLDRLCEAALRLRMNMFTWYFIDADWEPDRERLRAVADRGLFLTQHQMEGAGADSRYWDEYWRVHNPTGKPKEHSYRLHPDAFREFWSFYIRRWAEFSPQVVWEINLRGSADAPYEEPSLPGGGTPRERAEIISAALADLARLVRRIDPNPDLERMTTLYAEQGGFYDEGWLKVPEGVTTGFADAGMSGMSYSKKFWTEPRDPTRRYGQYFHTQYFGGGPQIAKCTPVATYLKPQLDAMHSRGDTHHMLLAMNELRHQQIEIRAVADMLWDYPGFEPRSYMRRYCAEEFGAPAADRVLALYDDYYAKYPHKMIRRELNPTAFPSYYKVMEPLFTAIANLLNIESGNRDGFVLNYQFNRAVYERGFRDLGDVLTRALALRPEIPPDRRSFFDYEFVDAIRQVRGIYRICVAANDAIARLKEGDRRGALAALLDAREPVEQLRAAYENNCSGERWRDWYRSGTNEDVRLLHNLYQKARLRLETETMEPVTGIEPERHPYLGNVALHDPAGPGDEVYGAQAERINGSMFNGAPFSIVSLPLRDSFQIAGVQSTYSKWKLPVPDYGLPCSFDLHTDATVTVARQRGLRPGRLETDGFTPTGQTMEVGHWTWPFRYRNRPPTSVVTFDLFAKRFRPGRVALGPHPTRAEGLPYVVFVQPDLLAYENFRGQTFGTRPRGWRIETPGGRAEIVPNPDYAGAMRESVFDLATVRRYRPLDLRSLRIVPGADPGAVALAELPFRKTAPGAVSVHVRLRPVGKGARTIVALVDSAGHPALEIECAAQNHAEGAPARPGATAAPASAKEAASCTPDHWHTIALRLRRAPARSEIVVEDERAREIVRRETDGRPAGAAPLAALRFTAQGAVECGAAVGWAE